MANTEAPRGMRSDFFFAHDGARDVCQRFLDNDVQGARLSRTFRLYYLLRPLIPIRVRQFLQGHRNVEVGEDWYIPDAFFESLARAMEGVGQLPRIVHPWPEGSEFGFVLTHDVETDVGMGKIQEVADLEESLGFRSSWNLVPKKYPIDQGLVRELVARGFEIGIHGYNHDGRLFWSRATFQRRVPLINRALQEYGAVGFRSPMAHRNLEWMQELDIEYDSSCFDIDPYQPMPGGVGSLWPFTVGRFVEMPYTLPQDHTVFIALGDVSTRIWERKLDWIARRRGLALMCTHPDYLDTPQRLGAYRDFLTHVRDRSGVWHALPAEAARWWRQREASTVERTGDGPWRVAGPAAKKARVATLCFGDEGFAAVEAA